MVHQENTQTNIEVKIVVTGLESSGTKMMVDLLRQHPNITVHHTSIPQEWMPITHLPNLDDCDRIVWMLRYEPFRLQSINIRGYDKDRPEEFVAPGIYQNAIRTFLHLHPKIIFVSYEGIVGPLKEMVVGGVLSSLGLQSIDFDLSRIMDANLQYLTKSEP